MAQNNIPVVICGSNKLPVCWFWPGDTNSIQAQRIDAQIASSLPTQKRLWQSVIKSKLRLNAQVLQEFGLPHAPVSSLISQVRSGDSHNIEALAASRYWHILFGSEFRRDRSADGINALLNYGYTIVRSAMARAVFAAGLHPTVSINHRNKYNAFRLVDDLIEPYRPVVDWRVRQCASKGQETLDPATKEYLVNVLYQPLHEVRGTTPLLNSCYRLATSLAKVFTNERHQLLLPENIIFSEETPDDQTEWLSVDVDPTDV